MIDQYIMAQQKQASVPLFDPPKPYALQGSIPYKGVARDIDNSLLGRKELFSMQCPAVQLL